MEDTNTLEKLNELSPEEKAAKLQELYLQEVEARKKLQSDTDRWVQKVLEEKKYLEAVNEVMESKGNLRLLELWDENPQLADKIAKDKFWVTKEEAVKYWKDNGFIGWDEPQKQWLSKEDIKELIQQEKVNEYINNFKSNLWEEEYAKWYAEFKDLTDGKKLTAENVKKYIRLAQKEAIPDTTSIEKHAKEIALWMWKSWGKWDPTEPVRKANLQWLKDHWIT